MKTDRINVVIGLLLIVIIGLLFQNRKLSQRLSYIEDRIEVAIEHAESAERNAEEAASNSFGNVCSECPEDLRYR